MDRNKKIKDIIHRWKTQEIAATMAMIELDILMKDSYQVEYGFSVQIKDSNGNVIMELGDKR